MAYFCSKLLTTAVFVFVRTTAVFEYRRNDRFCMQNARRAYLEKPFQPYKHEPQTCNLTARHSSRDFLRFEVCGYQAKTPI